MPDQIKSEDLDVAIIGGGPAGLMAAEILAGAGREVHVFDAMPSVGRKLLLAGIGGLNITHSEPFATFCTRYGPEQGVLQPMLDGFTPEHLCTWLSKLGIETFVGSSGRVFPAEMKAAPFLRAWLHRLRQAGVSFHAKHRWQGWDADGYMLIGHPAGHQQIRAKVTLLALGGGSWPKLGSDGAWLTWLQAKDIAITPLRSANCGFDVAWSAFLQDKFAGQPLKSVAMTVVDRDGRFETRQGELVISRTGVEGSLIYAFSRPLRENLEQGGRSCFYLDLLPAWPLEKVQAALAKSRGSRSLSSHLQSQLGLKGVKAALLHEVIGKTGMADMKRLAETIKSLPIIVTATRPLVEAISTAGGIAFSEVDAGLMLKRLPGVFVAGEMLDWEAPTGGYLLTACLATGKWAGESALAWLQNQA